MGHTTFRWLGVAGFELQYDQQRLLVDPYLTRIPLNKLWFGKISPDKPLLIAEFQPVTTYWLPTVTLIISWMFQKFSAIQVLLLMDQRTPALCSGHFRFRILKFSRFASVM
jgi:hypothetical protein